MTKTTLLLFSLVSIFLYTSCTQAPQETAPKDKNTVSPEEYAKWFEEQVEKGDVTPPEWADPDDPFFSHLLQDETSTLPPWGKDTTDNKIIDIYVGSNDSIKLNTVVASIEEVIQFLNNEFEANRKKGYENTLIISLRNGNGASYEPYMDIYHIVQDVYNREWNHFAQERFGKSYDELPTGSKKAIRNTIPFIISEAEPTSFD